MCRLYRSMGIILSKDYLALKIVRLAIRLFGKNNVWNAAELTRREDEYERKGK